MTDLWCERQYCAFQFMFLVAASVCAHEVHVALVHFQGASSAEVSCDLMFCCSKVLNVACKCGVFPRMKTKYV